MEDSVLEELPEAKGSGRALLSSKLVKGVVDGESSGFESTFSKLPAPKYSAMKKSSRPMSAKEEAFFSKMKHEQADQEAAAFAALDADSR